MSTPFGAIVAYTVRVCVPPKRRVVLAIPTVVAVLFGLLARLNDNPFRPAAPFARVVSAGYYPLVVPLACLVVGDAVLGAEVRAGTFALTWLTPVSFPTIVVGRWLAGWLLAAMALVPAAIGCAVAGGQPGAIGAMVVATLAGAGAYLGLFVFIGAAVRRAALWSIGVVLLVERLLGAALTGIAQLSPQWLARAVYAGLGPDTGGIHRGGIPDGTAAVVRLAIVGAVLVALAIWRTSKLELTGADD